MSRSPLRFTVAFLVLLGVLTVGARSSWVLSELRDPLRSALAHAVSASLAPFGVETTVERFTVRGETGAIEIIYDCDGVGLLMFFVAAAVAFPIPRRRDLAWGLAWGLLVIGGANLFRLSALAWLQIRYKDIFEFVHAYLFQGFLILVTVIAWAAWVLWALGRTAEQD